MEYREFTGKTVEDAVMEAAIKLETTSDKLDYEILEKGSSGFLGIGSKPAKIKARKLMETVDRVEEFLADVFAAMQIDAKIEITENKEENTMNVDLSGEDMGVLIGTVFRGYFYHEDYHFDKITEIGLLIQYQI